MVTRTTTDDDGDKNDDDDDGDKNDNDDDGDRDGLKGGGDRYSTKDGGENHGPKDDGNRTYADALKKINHMLFLIVSFLDPYRSFLDIYAFYCPFVPFVN